MGWLADFKCSLSEVNVIVSLRDHLLSLQDYSIRRRYNLVGIVDINTMYVRPIYARTISIIIVGVTNNPSSVSSNFINVIRSISNCVMGNVSSLINFMGVKTSVINNLPCAFVYSCSTVNDSCSTVNDSVRVGNETIKKTIKGSISNDITGFYNVSLTSGITNNVASNNTTMVINTLNTPHDFAGTIDVKIMYVRSLSINVLNASLQFFIVKGIGWSVNILYKRGATK